MKKRTHSRRASTRKTRQTRTHKHTYLFPFSFRRIILITTCIAIVFGFFAIKNQGVQSVAGIQITKGLFAQTTVKLPQIENAVSFNIYFKEKNEGTYKNAVRDIPAYVDEYNISYLTKSSDYVYKIAAVDVTGAEFWFSDEKPLENLQSM